MVADRDTLEEAGFAPLPPRLTTERLVLRRPCEDDAEALAALADNRQIAEMLARMPHPYGRREALSFIDQQARKRSGAAYAVTRALDGALVGCAGLDATDRGLELGYWIGQPFWGRGYATEAAHALVDLAFRDAAVNVLHASCRVINPASRRVIHKCGFQYAGQGMVRGLVSGQVPVERYRLDRRTFESLSRWIHI